MTAYIAGKSIHHLAQGQPIIKLNSNESNYSHAPEVIEVLSCQHKQVAFYPSFMHVPLIQAISSHHQVGEQQLMVTSGSSEAINLIIMALSQPEQVVITSRHAFQLYAQLADLYQRPLVLVSETTDWKQDLIAMKTAINENTAIIFLANPCNPLGTSITMTELHDFIQSVPAHITVVVDEAYAELMGDDLDYQSMANLISTYDNLIVTRTFSKLYGLAGLRVGYALASEALIAKALAYQLPFSVNQVAADAAVACLNSQVFYDRVAQSIIHSRHHCYNAFVKQGFKPFANTANFLTIDIQTNAAKVAEDLEKTGVYVRPLGDYQLPTCLRVSIGTADEMSGFLFQFSKVMQNRFEEELCI